MSKVKIRLMSHSKSDVEKLRRHFLKKHPQLILGHPRQGQNPKYDEAGQKWFVYGDYEFGKVRRRRNQ
tara:strand:+ start:378 stop:581 length:204 start_codon:yes stop_codon:yes gene_type:complete